jgi:ABC-type sugar transport system ATPase subunit
MVAAFEMTAFATSMSRRSATISGPVLQATGSPKARTVTSEESTDQLIRCEDLSAEPRLQNIDLVLHRGEVLGIAGLDGSGEPAFCERFGATGIYLAVAYSCAAKRWN